MQVISEGFNSTGPNYGKKKTGAFEKMLTWKKYHVAYAASITTRALIINLGACLVLFGDSASEKRDMQVRDPDDNLLTLATPPSPPFPPA